MRLRLLISIFCAVLFLPGCYLPTKGWVIDTETGAPVEGAIVLVEWSKKHGFGDAWTESYKVVETVSDKDGSVKVAGCYSPFVEPPDVTVYKKGYVAWSSRWIFPDNRNRVDFKWGKYVFKLEHFKDIYSYMDHTDFLRSSINSSINLETKQNIYRAFYWETQLASKERDQKAKKQ